MVHDGPVMAAGVARATSRWTASPGTPRSRISPATRCWPPAHLLIALQSLVSRNVNPVETAVVSICTVHGGSASNQIPSQATMTGTVRTHQREVRDQIEAGIHRIAEGVGRTFEVKTAVSMSHGVSRDDQLPGRGRRWPRRARPISARRSGATCRRAWPARISAGIWRSGPAPSPGSAMAAAAELHNPDYNYNDAILPVASGWLAATARRALAE